VVVEQLRPNTVGVFRANDDVCFHACLHGGHVPYDAHDASPQKPSGG